jgi:hypothetical protein
MTIDRAALVEKIARATCCPGDLRCGYPCEAHKEEAEIALNAILPDIIEAAYREVRHLTLDALKAGKQQRAAALYDAENAILALAQDSPAPGDKA